MKTVTSHTNANSDYWLCVPASGNYPMLLLESLSSPETFALIQGIDQRAYDEDAYGIDKYIQVNFKSGVHPMRIAEIASYLNLNA